jgi:hypothetical protein
MSTVIGELKTQQNQNHETHTGNGTEQATERGSGAEGGGKRTIETEGGIELEVREICGRRGGVGWVGIGKKVTTVELKNTWGGNGASGGSR